MPAKDLLREQLALYQDWGDAHLTLDAALEGLPADARGVRPAGAPHSVWELVEHIRIAQRDILDFCLASEYRAREWPAEYWPTNAAPADESAWERSLAALREDRESLRGMALDPSLDLLAVVPRGSTQTYLRALLLTQDHAAYHIGQIVLVRRLLGV